MTPAKRGDSRLAVIASIVANVVIAGSSSVHIGPNEIVVVLELVFVPRAGAADVMRGAAAIREDLRREHPDVSRVLFEPVAVGASR